MFGRFFFIFFDSPFKKGLFAQNKTAKLFFVNESNFGIEVHKNSNLNKNPK
jgi:hypothetical protein